MFSHWNTSHGWGIDEDDGWGGRYYFTYYTTLGSMDPTCISLEIILYIVIFIFSILANVMIIIIVFRKKEIQTATNCFIVNLAVADLIFVLGIPYLIVSRMSSSWCLGETICKLLPYSQFVCGSVLLWTLTFISVDRLRCLTTSPYYEGIKQTHAMIVSLMTWFFCIIIHIPVLVFFKEQKVQTNTSDNNLQRLSYARSINLEEKLETTNVTICTLIFPAAKTNFALMFTLPITIISCIIPMVILIVNYRKIFIELKNISKKLELKAGFADRSSASLRDSVQTITSNLLSSINLTRCESKSKMRRVPSSACMQRLKKHRRSVRFLYCNVITVILMWLPMPIIMFLIYFDGHRWDTNYFLTTHEFRMCVVLALANTIVNPIFYGFLTENFKKNIRLWFKFKRTVTVSDDLAEQANMNSSSRNDRTTS